MKTISIHCYIKGRVQGVWFRANTKKHADSLGLTGWVRNLADGRVEVFATGPKEKIASLKEWLAQGPERAQVESCSTEEVPVKEHNSFDVID